MDIIERFFDKWWKLLIYSAISATIAVLSSTFYNEWLLLLGLILGFIFLFTSIFYKKHWRLTMLTVLLNLAYVSFAFFFWVVLTLFPTPGKIHHNFAQRYENKKEIQNIIGIKIPKFKVIDSHLVNYQTFDFEFETQCEIEFRELPDDKLFQKLDSICNYDRCWSRNGNEYQYSRVTDFEGKLHSTDAYFYFTITKGSKRVKIKYGNV